MNRKGAFVGLMVFVVVIILAMALAGTVLKSEIERTRNANNLDCNNSSITTFTALSCLVIDLANPVFLITAITTGAGYFAYRWYKSGGLS